MPKSAAAPDAPVANVIFHIGLFLSSRYASFMRNATDGRPVGRSAGFGESATKSEKEASNSIL